MTAVSRSLVTLAGLGLVLAACTTSYGPEELRKEELGEAAETRSEAEGYVIDAESGGRNVEALEEGEERDIREADL